MKKFDFNSLVAAEKQQSVDDHANYQNLLREVANHECTRSEAEILRLLERNDRCVKDLQEDAEWRITRDEKIAEVKREEEYVRQRDEAVAEREAIREEFRKIKEEYERKEEPFDCEINRLNANIRNIHGFRSELYETCRDVPLQLELESREASWDDNADSFLYERQRSVSREIERVRHQLNELPITQNRTEVQRELRNKLRSLENEYAEIEAKKAEFEQKRLRHKEELEKVRQRMIFS